VELMGRGGV